VPRGLKTGVAIGLAIGDAAAGLACGDAASPATIGVASSPTGVVAVTGDAIMDGVAAIVMTGDATATGVLVSGVAAETDVPSAPGSIAGDATGDETPSATGLDTGDASSVAVGGNGASTGGMNVCVAGVGVGATTDFTFKSVFC